MAEPLITLLEFEEWLGHGLPGGLATRAQTKIRGASALVRLEVAPALDAVEPPNVPDAVQVVMFTAVERSMENPRGLSGEAIDGHQWQEGGATGVYLTDDEKATIRQAVGQSGDFANVALEGYLPLRIRYFDEDVLASIADE